MTLIAYVMFLANWIYKLIPLWMIMTYIKIPVLGILGFIFGSCITIIITLLFIPAREFWPSSYEDRVGYIREITRNHGFNFVPTLKRLNKTVPDESFLTEGDYLKERAAILCYSIEQEADNEKHAQMILDTWGKHCNHMIMFHTNVRFMETLHPKYKPPHSKSVELVYIGSSNSTIRSLFSTLHKHLDKYHWFTYVPPKVYLMPDNLRYFLVSSRLNPKDVTFSGRPDISKLTGTWAVSMKSPLTMSKGAIAAAMDTNDESCLNDYIQGELKGGGELIFRCYSTTLSLV